MFLIPGSKPLPGLDGVESLIANVAGWLLMFQKDKATPEKERKTRKVRLAFNIDHNISL